jgi:hypothetical protein
LASFFLKKSIDCSGELPYDTVIYDKNRVFLAQLGWGSPYLRGMIDVLYTSVLFIHVLAAVMGLGKAITKQSAKIEGITHVFAFLLILLMVYQPF